MISRKVNEVADDLDDADEIDTSPSSPDALPLSSDAPLIPPLPPLPPVPTASPAPTVPPANANSPALPPIPPLPPLPAPPAMPSTPEPAAEITPATAPEPATASEPAPEPTPVPEPDTSPAPRSPLHAHLLRPPTAFQRLARRFDRFGGESFIISVAVHIGLIFLAVAWTVAVIHEVEVEPQNDFATGAGGGRGGVTPSFAEHRIKPRTARETRIKSRIVARGATSRVTTPEIPFTPAQMLGGEGVNSPLSKGAGGGLGGGKGGGLGVGIGGKRNFVSRSVFGKKISAKKIAVYVDNSGSMEPHLAKVRAEVKKQFPDADIFECFGVGLNVIGGRIAMGRQFSEKKFHDFAKAKFADKFMVYQYYYNAADAARIRAGLSPQGQEIFDKHWPQFYLGQAGAWFDIMLFQHYDALIIFADFEDGVRQTRYNDLGIYNRWHSQAGTRQPHQLAERRGLVTGNSVAEPKKSDLSEKEGDPYPTIWFPSWGAWAGAGNKHAEVYREMPAGEFYDFRAHDERAWEREWLERCADAEEGPRIYLFSISAKPQSIWRRCVRVSDGAINMMPQLAGGRAGTNSPIRKPVNRNAKIKGR